MDLKTYIRDVPDFPKKGIIFKDITPLLRAPEALEFTVDALAKPFRNQKVTKVAAIESRGFIFGSGPAGEKGAAQAAYFGKRVALIEREPVLGGACVNTGTIPSKTLRESALHLSGFRQRGFTEAVDLKMKSVTIDDFMYRKQL